MDKIQTLKQPKAPTFLGAIIYLFAGIILTVAGVGLSILGAPSYYPGAVWYTIAIVYTVLGGIVLGLGYRRLKRFFRYIEPDTESGETAEAEHYKDNEKNAVAFNKEWYGETLAEKRP